MQVTIIRFLSGRSLTIFAGAIALLTMQPVLAQETKERSSIEVETSDRTKTNEKVSPQLNALSSSIDTALELSATVPTQKQKVSPQLDTLSSSIDAIVETEPIVAVTPTQKETVSAQLDPPQPRQIDAIALERPSSGAATTLGEWRAQLQQPQEPELILEEPREGALNIVEITEVRVQQTPSGLAVELEAGGELSVPETVIEGNVAVAEISGAVLKLPEAEEFIARDPGEGISLVRVTNLPDNRVQLAITGIDAPPTVAISVGATGLALSVAPGTLEGEVVDIVVVAEREEGSDYFEPTGSSATRTDTPLLDTPQSIQIIPQQVLEDQQILDINDAFRNVSGITGEYTPVGSGTTLTIRGFSTNSFSNGPLLRDGFRIYDNFSSMETANLERIEVIRGPASVLYGQSDPGGIINLVTKQPLSEPFYEVQLQGGSFDLIRPSLDFSGPLTANGSLRYRLNAAYQHEESFRDFDVDFERFFIAPVISLDLSDRTTLSVSMEYLDEEAPYDTQLIATPDGVVDVPLDRNFNEPDDFRSSESLTLGYNLEHQFDDDWTLRNAFRYIEQNYDIPQVTLPIAFDEATGILNRVYGIREYNSEDYSVQTNVTGEFTTGPIEHIFLAGIDLNWNRFDDVTKVDFANFIPLDIFDPEYGVFPRPDFSTIAALPATDTNSDRVGVFLQDQISLTDNLIVVGSLRYDSIDLVNTEANTGQFEEAWSPRFGIVYQPTENLSLYSSYSESFVPNTALGVDGEILEPETSQGFEFGLKAELFDRNLLATLAYFDITKNNVATVADPVTGASIATGEQQSQGIEFDLSGEILPGWNAIGFYAYTDATVTEDNTISIGNRLPNAPEHSFGLWTTYEIQKGDLQGLGFGLGVNYVSSRFGNLDNDFQLDDYFLTNAALFYRRDSWEAAININNLFDIDYITTTNGFNLNAGNAPGAPFSIVGSVSIRF